MKDKSMVTVNLIPIVVVGPAATTNTYCSPHVCRQSFRFCRCSRRRHRQSCRSVVVAMVFIEMSLLFYNLDRHFIT